LVGSSTDSEELPPESTHNCPLGREFAGSMPRRSARRRAIDAIVEATDQRVLGVVPTDIEDVPAGGGQPVVATLIE